ncbi:MAG: sugar ABC transporter ATP-binding protein [Paenirhodobacter sp.]|uniref:sugar ABC transporter ATP-binding protein n=1 Tax=Paenirhodobacter sp. TaxID=1965326 RepID=UPI003D0D7CED
MPADPLLEARGLTKAYPGVLALDAVDFDLRAGEVHVLFGENGAGKSTMISLLAGANTPSAGEIRIRGEAVSFASVADAQARGIYTVFQEFSLVPTMSVAQNMFLGHEPGPGPFLSPRAMRTKAAAVLADLGFDIRPEIDVGRLSRAQQQMVEIAKAMQGALSVLILDEPTASLTDREVDQLFAVIARLKAQGVGIIYISHRVHEFERIAERVTVLRDGARIGTEQMAEMTEQKLVDMMAGREIRDIYPRIAHNPGDVILEIDGLSGPGLRGASVQVRRGEVLGVAGLVGSGKSRLFRAAMGLNATHAGRVRFKGRDMTGATTRAMVRAGAWYLSPDRKHEGLILAETPAGNLRMDLMLAGGAFLRIARLRAAAERIFTHVELPPAYRVRSVGKLSGGNQQKVLFGKAFGHEADLYIFDEPTVGVDMGTRAALYRLIAELAESGKAVVVISSDLPEVMNLAHRAIVLANGRITAELPRAELREEVILRYFFDAQETDPVPAPAPQTEGTPA